MPQRPLPKYVLSWLLLTGTACSSEDMAVEPPADGGTINTDGGSPASRWPASAIRHVVIIVEENHTFDSYFGRYCKGPAGISCDQGPSCCEAAPATQPTASGTQAALLLNGASNYAQDRNHESGCELAEMHWDGQRYRMDRFVDGAGSGCSDPDNFALVDPKLGADDTGVTAVYWSYAQRNALAVRFFQPIVGSTSSNDMYLATAQFHFLDNQAFPKVLGTDCQLSYHKYIPGPLDDVPATLMFHNTTIADLLIKAVPDKPFAFYHQGYKAILDAKQAGTLDSDKCPPLPSDCFILSAKANAAPCSYDPSDNPFRYFTQFADGSEYARRYLRDSQDLAKDVESGSLPAVSFLKALSYTNEHPNWSHIWEGTSFVDQAVSKLMDPRYGEMVDGRFLPYSESTLILLTWDEGGGFFDHVPPPRQAPVDGRPYGTRVPLLALGKFAKRNYISHVEMEHSSIVKFIEWNFLGKKSGQLAEINVPTPFGGPKDLPRDRVVNNIGDLLDPAQTGVPVPIGSAD